MLELIKVTDLDGPGNGAPFIFSVVGDYADKFSVDSDGVLKNTMKLGVGSYKFKVSEECINVKTRLLSIRFFLKKYSTY